MSGNKRPDRLLTVKEQFRRKEIDGQKYKRISPQMYDPPKKREKPKTDGRFFDPDEFSGDKPLMRDFRGVKGEQPEWVKLKYQNQK